MSLGEMEMVCGLVLLAISGAAFLRIWLGDRED
jgi:hypothetical protein